MPVSAILFDHDGLLVETEWLFYQATLDVLREKGLAIPREVWSREYLSAGRHSSDLAVEHGYPAAQARHFVEVRNALYRRRLEEQPPLLPDAEPVLRGLKRDHRLALVTGNSRSAIDTVHRGTGLLGLFELIVTHEDFERPKPAPDAYRTALERLALPPDRCIAVEDSERGLQAALAAGLRCIAIPGVLTRDQAFPGAACVLGTLAELPSALERL